jgi:hypothetical protein
MSTIEAPPPAAPTPPSSAELKALVSGLERAAAAVGEAKRAAEQAFTARADRITQDASLQLRRVQSAAQDSIAALDARVQAATPTLNDLEVRATALSQALAGAKAQADAAPAQLQRALASLELQLAQRDAERTRAHDEARAREATALKAREAEVSALILRLSAHLEGAGQREQALLAAVRGEHAKAEAQREAQVTALVGRLSQAETRAEALLIANQALRERVDALEERTVAVEKKKVFGIF